MRHSYAFALAEATGSDAYELERRLGHQSQRYIHRYTNPPENIAASYVENLYSMPCHFLDLDQLLDPWSPSVKKPRYAGAWPPTWHLSARPLKIKFLRS